MRNKLIGLLLFFTLLAGTILPVNAVDKKVNIYVFYSHTCIHCAAEEVYLDKLKTEDSSLSVYRYEITDSKENQELMKKVGDLLNTNISTVPFVIIGNRTITGFTEGISDVSIDSAITYVKEHNVRDLVGEMLGIVTPSTGGETTNNSSTVTLPFFGTVDASRVSLPLMTIVLGTLDGFNPCAMWVLLLLISMLLNSKNRFRMWILGGTFLLTSAFMYFLFMLSWLNITVIFGKILYLRLLIGIVAIGGGAWNIKTGMKKDDGCDVVDVDQRKKLRKRIQGISSQSVFILAIFGMMGLAVSVNLIELLCSAGFPVLFTQVLSLNHLTNLQYIGYLLLYVFFFLLDDLVVFIIAMKTSELTGISTKYGKYSHLVGGAVMILLGILMVLKPEWLMLNF